MVFIVTTFGGLGAAAIVAGGLGAGAAVIGSRNSSNAARQISNDATQTAANNNALAREIYDQNRAVLAPYVQTGNQAGTAMQSLLGLSGDPRAYDQAFNNYRNSTGYQFQFDQGNRAIQNSAAAQGGLLSGNAIKAGQRYGQQMGQSSFQQYLDRLYGQQGVGLTGASAQAGVGTNYGQQVTSNNNAALDARGNATLSSAGNTNSLLASLTGTAGNVLGQQAFGSTYGNAASPNNFSGGSVINWADSLPGRNTPIGLYG